MPRWQVCGYRRCRSWRGHCRDLYRSAGEREALGPAATLLALNPGTDANYDVIWVCGTASIPSAVTISGTIAYDRFRGLLADQLPR